MLFFPNHRHRHPPPVLVLVLVLSAACSECLRYDSSEPNEDDDIIYHMSPMSITNLSAFKGWCFGGRVGVFAHSPSISLRLQGGGGFFVGRQAINCPSSLTPPRGLPGPKTCNRLGRRMRLAISSGICRCYLCCLGRFV